MGEGGQLRIGLTISGAIALGAYEGGALAALHANHPQSAVRGERSVSVLHTGPPRRS